MADANKNWISLNRSLLLNDLWRSEPFTKGQAWVDMLLATNFKEGIAYLEKGVNVPVKRGQLCRSMKQLAIRWKWSEGKVKRYLEFLSSVLEQITFENYHKNGAGNGAGRNAVTTLITITNYETYQDNDAHNEAGTAQEQGTNSAGTVTYNKVNKGNNENKEPKTLSPDALRLSEMLGVLILENDAGNSELSEGKKIGTLARWSDCIDKINRLDGRPWDEIESVIEWCQQDDFWRLNILSGSTLRKKFNQLSAKASAKPKAGNAPANKSALYGAR